MTLSEIGEHQEIKVHVSAPVPFPEKGSFVDLRRMPDDLTRIRRWGISQQQTEKATIAVALSHLQADVLRQLELYKPELEYATWSIFRLECLRATKALLGGGMLNHEFLQSRIKKKESLREFWSRLRNMAEILHRTDTGEKLNERTGSVFATGVSEEIGQVLLAKLDEKALTPNEIIELAERKTRKEQKGDGLRKEISEIRAEHEAEIGAMKRSREEEPEPSERADKKPRRDFDRASRGKGKRGTRNGRDKTAHDDEPTGWTLDGKPVKIVLDTGAQVSVITEELRKEFGLKTEATSEIRLNFPAGGAVASKTAKFPLRSGENTIWVEAYVVEEPAEMAVKKKVWIGKPDLGRNRICIDLATGRFRVRNTWMRMPQ
ncbi:hypothetical protein FOL47_010032 [Perkinsus chesapeaki]|uniref:Peptidase A2 domain-containing protein n=1 Tax=Perkinsus chesapeaki TaxID=330153 RepID=A0A7J6L556_PERCH|nr:hypothetical protein FOL47_010032 [Perkinsus chesapeaki]